MGFRRALNLGLEDLGFLVPPTQAPQPTFQTVRDVLTCTQSFVPPTSPQASKVR